MNNQLSTNVNNKSVGYSFDELEKMSQRVAKSNFLGTRNPDEVFTLFMIAQAEGKNPVQASMEYSIIQGHPALKSQAVLVRFQNAGGNIKYLKRDDNECKIMFSHPQAGELEVSWTMETARRVGLANKDNWRKYPRQMLAARCIAEGVRALYPACLNNTYSVDEVLDFDNKSFNNNAIDVEVVSNSSSYNAYEHNDTEIIQYDIVPSGSNKGKKWDELNIDVLAKAKQYYSSKNITQYVEVIEKVLNEKLEVCPTGISKGCKWTEISTEKLEQYLKDYKDGKLIGYASEYSAYIEKILLDRKNNQTNTNQEAQNITVSEEEDPFSNANDDNWDKGYDDSFIEDNEKAVKEAEANKSDEDDGFNFD